MIHDYKLMKPVNCQEIIPNWKIYEGVREVCGDYTEDEINDILMEIENRPNRNG
jgi:hypothetical protein